MVENLEMELGRVKEQIECEKKRLSELTDDGGERICYYCEKMVEFGVYTVKDGEMVKKHQTIAEADRSNGLYSIGSTIRAGRAGRIFLYIEDGEHSFFEETLIAVIGNASDTKEDVDKWLEEQNIDYYSHRKDF